MFSKLKSSDVLDKSSYPKNEYNTFYHKLDCSVFKIFLEKAVFSETTAKKCFESAFDHFLGKGLKMSVKTDGNVQTIPFVVFDFTDENSLTKTLLLPLQVLKLWSHHFYC